jgi:hypothetical protein
MVRYGLHQADTAGWSGSNWVVATPKIQLARQNAVAAEIGNLVTIARIAEETPKVQIARSIWRYPRAKKNSTWYQKGQMKTPILD